MSLAAGTFVHQAPVMETKKQKPIRVLILTKKNSEYGSEVNFKSGLNNTANFLAEELRENLHIETHFATCIDGNGIDKEVFQYKPSHVVLEAIWVTPVKLAEVQKLHPTVVFVIRVHSKITFLAYEGNAISWLKGYQEITNVYVGFNSYETFKDFQTILPPRMVIWLPNLYKKIDHERISLFNKIISFFKSHEVKNDHALNVACFGAIRPMKDILLQAVAAIKYCNMNALRLRFHVNTGRLEQSGDSTLKNLRALFQDTRHELCEHGWLNHNNFIELIKKIDLGMQVSMNESFNVVTADYVYNYKPIVVSNQVHWVSTECMANSTVDSIVNRIDHVLRKEYLLKQNLELLDSYNKVSLKQWQQFFLETEM